MRLKSQKSNRFWAYSKLFPYLYLRDHRDHLSLGTETTRNIGDKHAPIASETELLASRRTSRCTYQICMGRLKRSKTEAIWYVQTSETQTLKSPFGPGDGARLNGVAIYDDKYIWFGMSMNDWLSKMCIGWLLIDVCMTIKQKYRIYRMYSVLTQM